MFGIFSVWAWDEKEIREGCGDQKRVGLATTKGEL